MLVGALKLLRAGGVVRKLHATGLDKVLPLYPDIATALEL